MQNLTRGPLRQVIPILSSAALLLSQPGCSTLTNSQKGAVLASAESLANVAGTAAATYYGGAEAGQLASAGLSALGSVLQGYIGTKIPTNIVQATPGVGNVGEAVAPLISASHNVTQADVNTIDQAAQLVVASTKTTGTSK